jgi:DNA-binding response OmpR family regulator
MSERQYLPKALLAEQPSLAMVTEEFLESIGFDALHAPTAANALAVVAAGGISLAVIGGSLPDMSGADLAAKTRVISPDLPIVLASGSDTEALAERFFGDGALSLLPKPYTERELRAAIAAAGGAI